PIHDLVPPRHMDPTGCRAIMSYSAMLSDLEPLRNGVDDSTGKPVPKADPATGTTKSCGDRPSHAPPAVGEPDARADSGRRPLLVSRCSQLPESSPSGCPSLYGHWAPV